MSKIPFLWGQVKTFLNNLFPLESLGVLHNTMFSKINILLYNWFHIKGTWSVHSFNVNYLYIPEGSCGYLFHNIPCSIKYSISLRKKNMTMSKVLNTFNIPLWKYKKMYLKLSTRQLIYLNSIKVFIKMFFVDIFFPICFYFSTFSWFEVCCVCGCYIWWKLQYKWQWYLKLNSLVCLSLKECLYSCWLNFNLLPSML